MENFISQLKLFIGLRELVIEENPFLEESNVIMGSNESIINPREVISQQLGIETLDGMKILDYIKKLQDDVELKQIQEDQLKEAEENVGMQKGESDDEQDKDAEDQQPQEQPSEKKKIIMPAMGKNEKLKKIPTLEKLLSHLESANRNSPDALKHLKNLASDVDKVIEPTRGIEQIETKFAPGKETEEIQEEIQTFMQNAQLLIDNHQELQGIMLSILAKLSIVKFQSFGTQCFYTLTDLMKSGRDMELQIMEVIELQVINKLSGEDPTSVPVTLLIGLHNLVDDCGIPRILRGMYDTVLGSWLERYSQKLENYAKTGQNFPDHEHYDAIISLVAVSVRDPGCIEKVMEKSLNDEIVLILKYSDWTKIRYIPCLDMVAAMANAEEEAANEFMKANVYQGLLKEVGSSLKIYKQYKSLFDENSKETIEQQLLKYNTLASEIRLLGGLLQSDLEQREKILTTNIPLSIIEIIGEKKTDPILLTACCTFAYDLLECNNIRFFQEEMEPYSDKMNNLVYMIPYLGFNMYPQLIEMSRRYYNAMNYNQKVTDSGSLVAEQNTENIPEELEETIDPEAKEAERRALIQNSMQHLNDQIVCDLFISIIRLIEFICREASCNTENDKFFEISQALNENDETPREQALFNCLEIPNDEVKLAAVKCLFVINIEDIDSSEISQITNVMSTCKNIGAGNTELVLSTIYWICTKFVIGDPEQTEQPKIFQEKYGEKTVNEALDILEANLQRVTYGDDDEEKYALSLSILNFLKASTIAPMMQKYLMNKSDKFKRILYYEDLNSSETVKTVPIDIENTLIGKEMNSLIDCISGQDTIQPYCDVSLRIIIRMADVLMSRYECEVYEISDKPDVIDELYEYQLSIYERKKQKELDFWIDKPARFYEMMEKQEDGDKYIHELRVQHQNFTSSNGVALLKMFLTSKYPINEEFMHQLINKQFDVTNQEREDGFIKELESFQSIKIQKFENKYMGEEYAIRKAMLEKFMKKQDLGQNVEEDPQDEQDDEQNNMMNANCRQTSYYTYMQTLQFEKLGNNYKDTLVDGDDSAAKYEMEQKLNAKKKEEEAKEKENAGGGNMTLKDQRGDGFLNKPIRNLTVAAYLRCLYAAIEYAPSIDLRFNAIQNIRDPLMFRTITQLCDSTDWDESAGIGAKYLRVMRHIIKLPLDKGSETADMLMHYELVSAVCQKALTKVIDKINKDIELTDKDQICQYEVSLTMFTILVQTQNYTFYRENVEKQNKIYEYIIANAKNKKKIKKKDKKFFENALQSTKGEWELKCKLKNKDYGKGEITPQDFHVEIPVIHLKRTIQQKIVEFMVLKLFTKQSIFSLIDMLFKDMNEDAKIFINDPSDSEEDEPEEEEEDEDEDGYIDVFKSSHDIEEYCEIKGTLTIERVKDIVGEIMCSCQKKMRYFILENIMKGVIFEKKKLRESFMQEILTAADDAQFRIELQKYLNDPFNHMMINPPPPDKIADQDYDHPVERIIEYVKCDIQDKILEDQYLKIENEDDQCNGWFLRHFVITNQGIQILKDIPEDKDCHNEPACDDQEFCPRGPYQETVIKFPDIKSIVQFPQLLQKLVIFYQVEERAQLFQLSINVPTYTKAAKIYSHILDIQKISEYEQLKVVKEPLSKEKEAKLKRLEGYDQSYVDMYVQAELRNLINEIQPMSKESARKLKLIYASYLQSERMVVGKDFFEEHIATDTHKWTGINKLDQGLQKSPFSDERELNVDDQVIVMVTFTHVILVVEQWQNWKLIKQPQQLNKWRKQQLREIEQQMFEEEQANEGKKEVEKKGIDEYQKEQEELCEQSKLRCSLFKVVTLVEIENIEKLEVHRGADPTIELLLNPQEKDEKGNKHPEEGKMFYHRIKILFPGDMERQMFVSKLIGVQKGEIEDAEVDEDEVDEDDSEEQDPESSLESAIEGYPYD